MSAARIITLTAEVGLVLFAATVIGCGIGILIYRYATKANQR